MSFEDWFHQVEIYSLLSERFYEEFEIERDTEQLVKRMVEWLKAAYSAGKASADQITVAMKPEWVGLSAEEIVALHAEQGAVMAIDDGLAFARVIEARLKAKNA